MAITQGNDYSFNLYRKLCLMNFDELPPVGLHFIKQVSNESLTSSGLGGGEKQIVTFVKACEVFDERNADVKVIRYSDQKRIIAINRLKQIMKNVQGVGA